MKTRSSSGVGTKIDLDFNVETLRITDCEQEDDGSGAGPQQKSSVYEQLKRSAAKPKAPDEPADPGRGTPAGRVNAEVDSTKLRQFLSNLGDS